MYQCLLGVIVTVLGVIVTVLLLAMDSAVLTGSSGQSSLLLVVAATEITPLLKAVRATAD